MSDKFLAGEEFSTGYRFVFEQYQPLEDRFSVFEKMFYNKNVLHIGCVDHLSEIKRKMKKNVWVHNRIAQVSRKCIGFDINGPGITALRRMNIDGVYEFDVCSGEHESTKGEPWDYMFMGEVGPLGDLATFEKKWRDTVESFRAMTAADLKVANNQRIRVVVARPSDSYLTLSQQASLKSYPEETLRVLNGHHPNGEPRAGDNIKIIQ